jgi:hypothetical protein
MQHSFRGVGWDDCWNAMQAIKADFDMPLIIELVFDNDQLSPIGAPSFAIKVDVTDLFDRPKGFYPNSRPVQGTTQIRGVASEVYRGLIELYSALDAHEKAQRAQFANKRS